MSEFIKKLFYQYITGFQLVMGVFILLVNSYGMPTTYEETAVYVAVALVAAYVYGKDKSTGVELKQIDITPMQEFQIKQVFELILKMLGYKATVEGLPKETEEPAAKAEMSIEDMRGRLEQLMKEKEQDG